MLIKSPADNSILHQVKSHVQTRGDSQIFVYLKSEDDRQSITYRQLDDRARSIARELLNYASPGDRALMMYPSGLEFIEAFLGCLYAGIIAVPAYPPTRNRNADRLLSIAQDCQPRLILCATESRDNWDVEITGATVLATNEIKTGSGCVFPYPTHDSVAFLQYTSGSTSDPKGVVISHGNLASNALAFQVAAEHDHLSVMASWLPMFHDMGLIGGILQPLYVGFLGILMAPIRFLANPAAWLQAITEFNVTSTGGPNFGYEHCLRKISKEQLTVCDLSSWKTAFNGAEPIRYDTLVRFSEKFATCGFNKRAFFPVYGLAEATLYAAGGPPLKSWPIPCKNTSVHESHIQHNAQRFVSNGQIACNAVVRIVEPETLLPLDDGIEGEIWIHGPGVAKGYWNRDVETKAVFEASLPNDHRPWLRTGDYGFLDENELFITGRLKDLIIIRGRNIYPQDVEQLVEQHFDFVEPNTCAAFSIEHGSEEALVVVAEGSWDMAGRSHYDDSTNDFLVSLTQSIDSLRSAIADQFEIVLLDLAFVRPTTFPRTSSGKVQRRLCRQMYLEHRVDAMLPERFSLLVATMVPPPTTRSDLLATICRVFHAWAKDEGKSLPILTAASTFSSLGIDSVAAADIGIRLEHEVGIKLQPDTLYHQRNIGELMAFIDSFAPTIMLPGANAVPLSRQDYLDHFVTQSRRFRDLRESGYDFFGTSIESQDGKHVIVDGARMLMLASYSYLGLINNSEVNNAASEAISRNGTGAHGVRLLAGTLEEHRQLELELAAFMHAEDSIVYNSGFLTNLATVSTLVGAEDVVLGDERNHASIVDGCKFSGASFETFRHNDVTHLEFMLHQHQGRHILVVVDAVYSMDGDIAPLPKIVSLCRRYGAMLMVDEAHSLGVIGATGRGVQEHFNLPDDAIDIKMGTLSKSIASCGGFVSAKREIIDFLKHSARGFIFSAALPAAQVGAARKCLEILRREPERTKQLQGLAQQFVKGLRELGFQVPPTESAIVPILFKCEQETLEAVRFCRERGLFVVPVFYPAVPMDAPRIRATVLSSFDEVDVAAALLVFRELAVCRRERSQSASWRG